MRVHLRSREAGLGRSLQVDERFEALVGVASRADAEARWADAGEAWSAAATFAMEHGALPSARACLERSGEAFRRGDQPRFAIRALRTALALPGAGDPRAPVVLAGALAGVGDYGPARVLCEGLVDSQVSPLALDTLAGICLATGDSPGFDRCVERLEAVGGPAAGFRRSQRARNRGELEAAWSALDDVAEAVASVPAGWGAVEAERAEILALRGDLAAADRRWAGAAEALDAAGRASIGWHLEASRVRALAWAGLAPLAVRLDEGVGLAEQRGLEPLLVDLLTARGLAVSGRDPAAARHDLDRAIRVADRLGEPLRAAKARLCRARLATEPGPMLAEAVRGAAISRPWQLRARAALATASRATDEVRRILEEFVAIGMTADALALRGWLSVAGLGPSD